MQGVSTILLGLPLLLFPLVRLQGKYDPNRHNYVILTRYSLPIILRRKVGQKVFLNQRVKNWNLTNRLKFGT